MYVTTKEKEAMSLEERKRGEWDRRRGGIKKEEGNDVIIF